jgi:ribonuclease P protein component
MLPKKFRLSKKSLIAFLLRKGLKKNSKYFVCRYRFLDQEFVKLRFAFLVSKKIHAKAVQRNKLRRQMSEIVRNFLKSHKDFQKSCDFVMLPLVSGRDLEFEEMKEDLEGLLNDTLNNFKF